MGSRRLSKDVKARLTEWIDPLLSDLAKKFIDPNDGKEFHEGMAAGLLLATEIVSNQGSLDPVSAQVINACLQNSILQTK